MSFRSASVLRGLLILSVAVATARGADDPAGWTSARWGMTIDQVRAAVPAAELLTGPTDERTIFCPDKDHPLTSPLGVLHLKLAGIEWSVFFLFRDAKLVQVSLKPAEKSEVFEQIYANVRDLLFEKYGRPFERETQDKIDHSTERVSLWSFPLTTIELNYVDFRSLIPMEILYLTYRQKTAQEGI